MSAKGVLFVITKRKKSAVCNACCPYRRRRIPKPFVSSWPETLKVCDSFSKLAISISSHLDDVSLSSKLQVHSKVLNTSDMPCVY